MDSWSLAPEELVDEAMVFELVDSRFWLKPADPDVRLSVQGCFGQGGPSGGSKKTRPPCSDW